MAIVRMKKVTVAAAQKERDEILSLLQSWGYVHIVDFKDEFTEQDIDFYRESNTITQTEMDFDRIKFTYDFLAGYRDKKPGLFKKREEMSKDEFDSLESKINWKDIYEQCKEIKDKLDFNKGENAKVQSELSQYSEWVNFDGSSGDLDILKSTAYFIGYVAGRYETQLFQELRDNFPDLYIEKVSQGKQNVNLFILCHKGDREGAAAILKKYSFTKAGINLQIPAAQKVSELNQLSKLLSEERICLIEKAKELSGRIDDIEKVYDAISTKIERRKCITKFVKTQKMFLLKGWLPEEKCDEFSDMIGRGFPEAFILAEEAEEGDNPPVALKNNRLAEPFEVITSMYSLPLPGEVDPTPILAIPFMLFFGMMMADIGYGLIMLIGTLIALKFMDIEGSTRKMVKLLLYCSFPTIVFGILYGSFFGGIIPLRAVWASPIENIMQILIVSIVLGIAHIFLGLGIKAYGLIKSGHLLDAVYDVFFWYGLITAIIWLLVGGGTFAKAIALICAAGLLLTQGRSNKTIAGKFFGGLYGLYGITSYLGDALSYSRLLALGLASGLIGWAFNLLIGLLGKGIAAFIFGPMIFLAGHTFNLVVGGLGTFVHTCRLQYLEFFGKFYEGGGMPYSPLKTSTKFIKLNTEK
jgi:Archaeal/vacuolar-type H+-ATPase subunit I